ncbi:LrgB family protein [Tetragenococcus halophilus]|uniref:LrgB family protein n=1 Tax=Tetragenococcus halophilus TaxID=51669 RepID=UPI0027D80F43|nr:LrgB family protein [Tetragenococcus halophilus]
MGFFNSFFYLIGLKLHKKWQLVIFTSLIFAIVCVIIFLLVFSIPLTAYDSGGQSISIWITPATVCLAIKLENKFQYLKDNYISNTYRIYLWDIDTYCFDFSSLLTFTF